jgi:hypothetical protein
LHKNTGAKVTLMAVVEDAYSLGIVVDSIGPLIAGLGQACFYVRAGVMVIFEVMASC